MDEVSKTLILISLGSLVASAILISVNTGKSAKSLENIEDLLQTTPQETEHRNLEHSQ